MLNQIKIDLLRMRKSKLTYTIIICQFLITFIILAFNIGENDESIVWEVRSAEYICLSSLLPIVTLISIMSAFISLKLSILEKKDGLLRNKVIIGTGRCGIFCSKVIVNYLFCVILLVIHMATVIITCAVYYKGRLPDAATISRFTVLCLLWLMFFSVLMAVIGLCLSSNFISIIFSFVIVMILPSLPESLEARIELPQYQGTLALGIMKFAMRIIPNTYFTCEPYPEKIAEMFVSGIVPALAMTTIFLVLGCLVFRRKDFN